MTADKQPTWATGSADVADYMLRPGGPRISAEAKLIYLTLFSYMGKHDTCHPKTETIAEGCGLSVRTVQRYLPELEAAGLVDSDRVERAKRGAVKREATEYRLYPPWAPKRDGDNLTPFQKGRQLDTLSKGVNVTPIDAKGCQPGAERVTACREKGDSVTPQVTHRSNPSEVTQLTLLPSTEPEAAVQPEAPASKATGESGGYSPEFEEFWAAYPRRKEKAKAWRVWLARLSGKGGKKATAEDLITAARNYATECRAEAREDKYIKHAATFLGPDNHWQEYLQAPAPNPGGRQAQTGRGYVPHSKATTSTPNAWKRGGGATA